MAPEQSSPRQAGVELFCISFIALFLELMMIRWAPSVVRLVAYYANLLLISSFLGLGAGAMLSAARRPRLEWVPVLLGIAVAFLMLARGLTLPESMGEQRFYAESGRILGFIGLAGIFITNAAIFVPLGGRIGELFDRLPPLHAYAWDLGGSLAGTVTFGLFSFARFSPVLGVVFVSICLLALLPRRGRIVPALVLAAVAAGVWLSNDRNAIWSPYYYITVREAAPDVKLINERSPALAAPVANVRTMIDPPAYQVSVNHDFYQPHLTLDSSRFSATRQIGLRRSRAAYDLPYAVAPAHKNVLVLGAGGGTDAEVAVLNGAERVDAVEIDPVLVSISREFNASGIYDNPRVRIHVDDARSFVRRSAGGYDMVVFGWLDSQALFSAMSNVRLDGFVYTVESIRAAYALLNETGTLSLSFFAGTDWMATKLVRMVAEGTGKEPTVYRRAGHIIIAVSRGTLREIASPYAGFARQTIAAVEPTAESEPPRDSWPFLYLSGRQVPADYLIVIAMLLTASLAVVMVARRESTGGGNAQLFFLGVGFLLLETKSIGDCSLYFGATWLVTTIVVAGVLLMVLASNLVALRVQLRPIVIYVALLASLVLLAAVDRESILALDYAGRLAWALLAIPLPIFFAGLAFSRALKSAPTASAALGANLIGAMVGGFAEYLSMLTGSEALMALVIVAYMASYAAQRVSRPGTPGIA
jgi:hypothetical protein